MLTLVSVLIGLVGYLAFASFVGGMIARKYESAGKSWVAMMFCISAIVGMHGIKSVEAGLALIGMCAALAGPVMLGIWLNTRRSNNRVPVSWF